MSIEVGGSFEEDFGLVAEQVEADAACYILVRTDDEREDNIYHWIFVSFVPDNCPVRHKMLYASTRDTTKKQLGEPAFVKELHATVPTEVTWAGYQAYLSGEQMSDYDLLSMAEREKMEEARMEIHVGVGGAGVHGVVFPLTTAAAEAVSKFAAGAVSYIQFQIDLDAETIDVAESSSLSAGELADNVPTDSPRYHAFRYAHEHEGEKLEPVVFFYSCPMESRIKERMLYSSCKEAAIDHLAQAGVSVEKKFEISEPSDISADIVHTTFHPPEKESKIKFAKPTVARRRPQRKKRGSNNE